MAAASLGAATPQAHASTQIEVGQWVSNTWVTMAQPVSILFQVGVRVSYYPMGASWSLTSPVPGQAFAPQAEIHVSQTNAQGQPIEWMVCTGTISPGWSIRNGTWSAICTIGHIVYAPPFPHWESETVSGAFVVTNTAVQSVSVSSDTPQTLTVTQDEPFVVLDGSGTLRWTASVDDGTELPANLEATGTFHLLPLVAGDQPYGQGTAVPPCTYFGTYGVDDPGCPRLYHRQFHVSEDLGGIDQTSADSNWTDPVAVAVHSFEYTGPRQGRVGVRVTIPGPAGAPVSGSRHVWLDPDGFETGSSGALPGSARGERDLTGLVRPFYLGGTYWHGAAYQDVGLADTYHEGADRWMKPGVDAFAVPACAHFARESNPNAGQAKRPASTGSSMPPTPALPRCRGRRWALPAWSGRGRTPPHTPSSPADLR